MLFIGKVPSLHMFVQSPKKFTLHLPGALFFFFFTYEPNRAQASYNLYFTLYCVLSFTIKFNVPLREMFLFSFFSISLIKGNFLFFTVYARVYRKQLTDSKMKKPEIRFIGQISILYRNWYVQGLKCKQSIEVEYVWSDDLPSMMITKLSFKF